MATKLSIIATMRVNNRARGVLTVRAGGWNMERTEGVGGPAAQPRPSSAVPTSYFLHTHVFVALSSSRSLALLSGKYTLEDNIKNHKIIKTKMHQK